MKQIHKEIYLSSTCEVRMRSRKLKPVHLAISFLKRNLGSRCRLPCNSPFLDFVDRISSASWCYWSWQFTWLFTWLFWRGCINNIERQRTNFILPLRGRIFWSFIPQKTTTLTTIAAIWEFISYSNITNIRHKLLCLMIFLVWRWANLNL